MGRVDGRVCALATALTFVVSVGVASASPAPRLAKVRAPFRGLHTYAQQLGRSATATTSAASASVGLGGPYSWWSWPHANPGYSELSQSVVIERTSTSGASYFWSHQFHSQFGDGGYVGLQDGSYPNHDKIALFSVWSADAAQGRRCGTFSGEGSGWSCRIDPYNWVPGRKYVLGVRIGSSGTTGAWYEATVTDTATGVALSIGRIHVPAGWGGLQGWVSWTEYFGAAPTTCATFPRARARFDLPTANFAAVHATGDTHAIGTGDCTSQIKDFPGGDEQIAPGTGKK
ncbi:MAG: hypothetical protein QOH28_1615 [Actinomycetota bacterium]|jgi:hypothetical protein|nr:hypothetical protein [Actinomycetota bacterium]